LFNNYNNLFLLLKIIYSFFFSSSGLISASGSAFSGSSGLTSSGLVSSALTPPLRFSTKPLTVVTDLS